MATVCVRRTGAALAVALLAAAAVVATSSTPARAHPVAGLVEHAAQAPTGTVRVVVELDAEGRTETAEAAAAVLDAVGASAVRIFDELPFLAFEATADDLEALAGSPEVVSVVEDQILLPTLNETVPIVESDQATDAGFDGAGFNVAVIDTGVDRTHPLLAGKVVAEACFSALADCPNGRTSQAGTGAAAPCTFHADCGHGTHVAGIASGRRAADPVADALGSPKRGVAPGAGIVAVQVFSESDDPATEGAAITYTSDILAALSWIHANRVVLNVAAVNLSLASVDTYSAPCDERPGASAYRAPIELLRAAGIATVASSGNNGARGALAAPACISSTISVGATDDRDAVTPYSNVAPFLSLLAPGDRVVSAAPGGTYARLSGTSMAAPHVAGAWAALRDAVAPSAPTVDAALAAFQASGKPISGIPRLRVLAGVQSLAPAPSPTTTTTAPPTATTTPPPVTPPTPGTAVTTMPAPGALVVGDAVMTVRDGQPVVLSSGAPAGTVVVAGAATPSGRGAWSVTADGRVFVAGDAAHLGSLAGHRLNAPIVGLAPTRSGDGYWLLGRDGGVFSFGTAVFFGSTGGLRLNQPVVGMAATGSGRGYWLFAGDGGVFSFGDARFFGSTGGLRLNAPVTTMAATPSGRGYWLLGGDGGVFTFGDARFAGSTGGDLTVGRIAAMVPTASGQGYWLIGANRAVHRFGDAR